MEPKVILITGASSGIGLRTAIDLAKAGHRVYGGARRTEPMRPIVDADGRALELDVTDDASMQAAVRTVLDAEGRIDVLVNNAGYGLYGAVEDIAIETARRQVETNVVGLARMTQLVMPAMRAQGSGRIINISSIGGTIHTPLGAWYHGTKFFVEGFTNTMRLEAAPFGIEMILVAPGLIDTGFNAIVGSGVAQNSGRGAYAGIAGRLAKASVPGGSDPKVISEAIRRAVEDHRPKTIYRAGKYGRLLPWLRRVLPARWFDAMIMGAVR